MNVFISYRREDSLDVAGRIYDRLAGHFGRDSVFIDVDTIPIGTDFRRYLSDWVARCDVLLVVIGPRWLDATHTEGPKAGTRRLEDPADFVRIEIAAALSRDISVVPVLVGGASMPAAERLPADLSDLVFRNAAEVRSGRDFHTHMDRLIKELGRISPRQPSPPSQPPPKEAPREVRPAVAVEPPAVATPWNLSFDGSVAKGGVPAGWFNGLGFVGGVSTRYEVRALPREGQAGGRCVRLRWAGSGPREKEFGTVMQRCPAREFAGKVVRLEGKLRAELEGASDWAGLWLRVDDEDGAQLFFDNMHDRPVRGTTAWAVYHVEAVVPVGAAWLNYGFLLSGRGTVWAENFSLRVRAAG